MTLLLAQGRIVLEKPIGTDLASAETINEAVGRVFDVIELTLRTPVALDALEATAMAVPEILIRAGTIVTPGQVTLAADAGARFLVSPGCTPALMSAMAESGPAFLPGTATLSEALAVLASPLPTARFCPTGGITATSAPSYLSLPNVGRIGGSWLTPADALADRDWDRIRRLAAAAAALG